MFYGLFENEKMNEWHVTTISNTAKNKGGSKQECVNLEAFIFDFTLYQSLKSIEVVFFLFNGDLSIGVVVVCSVASGEWVWMTWRDMSKSNHNDDNNDNKTTTINRKWFNRLKFNICLSLLVWLMSFIELSFLFLSFLSPSHTIFNVQFAIQFHFIVNYLC
jgi:hypothetical protein